MHALDEVRSEQPFQVGRHDTIWYPSIGDVRVDDEVLGFKFDEFVEFISREDPFHEIMPHTIDVFNLVLSLSVCNRRQVVWTLPQSISYSRFHSRPVPNIQITHLELVDPAR